MIASVLDIIGQILWFSILLTPVIAYFIVRKIPGMSIGVRIISIIIITGVLAIFLYCISIAIVFRDGMGPG